MRPFLVGSAATTGLILALALPLQRTGLSAEPTLEPFKGVTTNGRVQPGLFQHATTGIAPASKKILTG